MVYDQYFQEWAVTSEIKKWGELNFAIYGHCLAHAQKSAPGCPPPAKPSWSSPFQQAKRK